MASPMEYLGNSIKTTELFSNFNTYFDFWSWLLLILVVWSFSAIKKVTISHIYKKKWSVCSQITPAVIWIGS